MFATTGLLLPVGLEGAYAAPGRTQITVAIPRPETDLAEVANGRLRRNNER